MWAGNPYPFIFCCLRAFPKALSIGKECDIVLHTISLYPSSITGLELGWLFRPYLGPFQPSFS